MLLRNSKVSIQCNGFMSEFFNITRSIKQGCPCAPFLYILQAEPIACKIRNNNKIVGIELPVINNVKREAKINQFVDDTQFFAKNEDSLSHIFDDLKLYECASGAKLNKEKTTGLFIGRLKENDANFKEINWTKWATCSKMKIGITKKKQDKEK